MKLPMQVQMICGGGSSQGYGHIRRTLTLAEALRRDGLEVRVSGLNAEVQSMLPPQTDCDGAARVVVFDAPAGLDPLIAEARAADQVVVTLDWFGEEEPDVNVVIYPHQPVRARQSSYVGLEFLLIREEIASLPRCADGEGVLVVLGGGDVLGQGHAAAQRLAAQGLEVTLVQGPLAAEQRSMGGYRVLRDPADLPARLAACALAVTNGGGCMFEAMCLGKACIVLPQTPAEEALAKLALEGGAVLGVGTGQLRMHDVAQRQAAGHRAATLVDGQGSRRVAEIVRGLL